MATLMYEPAFGDAVSELKQVLSGARRRVLPRYATAFREGAAAFDFFVLLDGKVQRVATDGDARVVDVSADANRGALLGLEETLVGSGDATSRRRPCTVEAITDCVVLQVSQTDVARAMPPESFDLVRRKVFTEFVRTELRAMPIFANLDHSVMASLAPLWELEDHGSAGSAIFNEGDEGDKFYILLAGRVSILKGERELMTLATEDKGEPGHPFFGEMAILDGKPRMAAVRARTQCTLLVLQRRAFTSFMAMVPDFSTRLRAYKELRARQTELKVAIATERTLSSSSETNTDRVNRLVRAASALGN